MTEITGRPRSCRWSGEPPAEGMILRSPRVWYVVMMVRAANSDDYPHHVTLGRVSEQVARDLHASGVPVWAFAWDRNGLASDARHDDERRTSVSRRMLQSVT